MTTTTSEREFKLFLPDGWDKPPETPVEALKAARDLLRDEHKWTKGDWFKNAHPEHDPEDPFCNSWKVCAEGAIGMVTIGASRLNDQFPWDFTCSGADPNASKVYDEAAALLADALDGDYSSVPDFNDAEGTTYTDVMAAFDAAIGEQEENN